MAPPRDETIGQYVQAALERRGWSLGKLAERSGVSKAQLSLLTRGLIENPRRDTIEKIAQTLGVPMSDLFGETEPTPQLLVYSGVAWVPFVERTVHAGGDGWRPAPAGRTPLSEDEAEGHKRLYAAKVTGSCMEPFIVAGATVIWDPDMRHPGDGQMVVVSHDGDLIVKWAYRHGDGGYVLRSNDGQELRPNGALLEGVVVKIENDPVRGPRVGL